MPLNGQPEIVWLTTKEAADRLRHTSETLIEWAKDGRIPAFHFRVLPKGYLFRATWVDNPTFATASAGESAAEAGIRRVIRRGVEERAAKRAKAAASRRRA